jgi:LuxR family maltose regulon positive regulatory protein
MLAAVDELPLVLVTGPAGSGKSTAVAEWLGLEDEPVAWLGFAERAADLWDRLIPCLDGLGLDLDVPQPPEPGLLLGRPVLEALAAAIARFPRRVTVVLDGYELSSPELAEEVGHLLDGAADRLRLVITARTDPLYALHRYRLDGRIGELRAQSLAFTDDEAAELLERAEVSLAPDGVHQLNARLHGWAAGLRFAARALARAEHPEEALGRVVELDVDLNEYLVREVLQGQSPGHRMLLLHTSVPETLYPGLVDELAGPGSARDLMALARSNAFLTEVPDAPGVLRYSPFFRELLRAQLAYEDTEEWFYLHHRAARWLREHGQDDQALDLLVDVGAWTDVAEQLVADLQLGSLLLGADSRVADLVRRLPAGTPGPYAALLRAAAAAVDHDQGRCADELDRARGATPEHSRDRMLALGCAVVDAVRGSRCDDVDIALELVDDAARRLGTVPRQPLAVQHERLGALVQHARGVVAVRRGELATARRAFTGVLSRAGLPAAARADAWGHRALVDVLDGRLSRAARAAREAAALTHRAHVSGPGEEPASVPVAAALVALERADLAGARAVLTREAPEHDNPVVRAAAADLAAHLATTEHDPADAPGLSVLVDEERATSDAWLRTWLDVRLAELALARGSATGALAILQATAERDDPRVAVTAAAALTELGQDRRAVAALMQASGGEQPLTVQVARLLTESVLRSRQAGAGPASTVLDGALRLAAPEQLRRPFREAGPQVQRLLREHPALVASHPWLDGDGVPGPEGLPQASVSPLPRPPAEPVPQPLVEPLTARELEVLSLLDGLYSTDEMASRLFVSVNTVRTHVRSILRKLEVNRRNAAVRRARELGLLAPRVRDDIPFIHDG